MSCYFLEQDRWLPKNENVFIHPPPLFVLIFGVLHLIIARGHQHAAVTAQIIMLFSTDRGETEDPILRTFSTDPAMIPQQQRDLIASLRRKMIGRINKSTFAFDPIETL